MNNAGKVDSTKHTTADLSGFVPAVFSSPAGIGLREAKRITNRLFATNNIKRFDSSAGHHFKH